MRFNRFLHLIAFAGKAHRGSPASGGLTTKMPDGGAPSQAMSQPDFSPYLPLSGEGGRPDQPAEQSAHLGHRHRYQPFLPFEAAPFYPIPPGPPDAEPPPEMPGQHGQGDVPAPAVPLAHFILVQPYLAFGLLKAFLDGPAGASYPHQFLQGGSFEAKAHVIGQLPWLGDAAPGQQPVALARFLQGP